MKGNKHMKTITNIIYPAFALFAFACFAVSPSVLAVLPAPDGGYPGQNTAEGDDALFNLTTGTENTAIGFGALYGNTGGIGNTATGSYAPTSNTTGSQTRRLVLERSTETRLARETRRLGRLL